MGSLVSARRLQETQKGASGLLVFRSFGSSGAFLGSFGSPVEAMGDLKNLILGLESTYMVLKERSWRGVGNGVENRAEK